MDEAGRLGVRAFGASIHASGLEVAAERARGDLAEPSLPGQPDFNVIGLLRRKAHVAGAERDRAEMEAQRLRTSSAQAVMRSCSSRDCSGVVIETSSTFLN